MEVAEAAQASGAHSTGGNEYPGRCRNAEPGRRTAVQENSSYPNAQEEEKVALIHIPISFHIFLCHEVILSWDELPKCAWGAVSLPPTRPGSEPIRLLPLPARAHIN